MLLIPAGCHGEITYHPQVPGGAEQLERNIAIKKKTVIITFDDNKNVLDYAYQGLEF